MSHEQYHLLLDELVQATDEAELEAVIGRNLARLDLDFANWLRDRVNELREVDPDKASRLEDIATQVALLSLARPEDIATRIALLSLARRVERGELDFDAAVEQGTSTLSAYPQDAIGAACWVELGKLGDGIPPFAYNHNWAVRVTLAELMYQIAPYIHWLFPVTSETVILARANEAMGLRRQHKCQAALQIYERLVTICERLVTVAEKSGYARLQQVGYQQQVGCLMSMGDVYYVQLGPPAHADHLVRAEQYYTQALRVCDQADLEPAVRADILSALGLTVTKRGRPTEGIELLKESLRLRRSLPVELQGIHDCLAALARAYEGSVNYRAARTCLQEAIDRAPDVEAKIQRLLELAHVLGYLDESGSGEALEKALQLANSLADQPSAYNLRSGVYGALGNYRGRTGNLQGAMDAFKDAMRAAIWARGEGLEARWLANLALIYVRLSQWKEANEALKRAYEIHQQMGDYLAIANLYYTSANTSIIAGNLIEAARLSASAYVLYYQEQELTRMSYAALQLGVIYLEMGDLQRAEACIHYCLRKAEASGTLRLKSGALSILASLQARQNKGAEAVATCAKAIDLAEQIGDLEAKWHSRVKRGKLLEEQSSTREAEVEYRRAVKLEEAMRGRFRAMERRIQFQTRSGEAYTRLVRLLARQRCRPGIICEAFRFAERARSRTLIELLSRTHVRQPDNLHEPLTSREAELLAQLLALEESEKVGLEPAERHARLNQELEEVWRQMAEIDEAWRDYVDLRRTPVVDFREILGLVGD
jgi:tetratricopeptide (TPR) repeat protein